MATPGSESGKPCPFFTIFPEDCAQHVVSGVDPMISYHLFFCPLPRIVIFSRVEIFFQETRLRHNPRPIIFRHWILFPIFDQPLHSLDTPSEVWPNTGGLAPHPAVSALAKDGDWPPTALPQSEAHLHLPQDSPHPSQQPLHSPDWEPPLPLVTPQVCPGPRLGARPLI